MLVKYLVSVSQHGLGAMVDTPLPDMDMSLPPPLVDMLIEDMVIPWYILRADMLLPATDMDMNLPGHLMVDMLLPAMDMNLPGHLMVDMLLPAMDMDMNLPGHLMVDILLASSYRYENEHARYRSSYGGYAPPSYGYGYAPFRTSYLQTIGYEHART